MVASILGQAILGLLLADLLSGIFHWWMDRIANESWPVIGAWLIGPSRLHHKKPLAFADGSFWYRSGSNIITAGIVGLAWYLALGFSFVLVAAAVAASMANEIHLLAHQPRKAKPILRVLQEIGLIQSPKGHARYHRPPQNTNYCPITDWVNPILEYLQVWTRIERLLRVT